MRYRRADVAGATYFFTLNAADRSRSTLTDHVDALRESFRVVRSRHPFDIDAVVVLPDHLHLLMTLPQGDADFATRIMLIKQRFSRQVPKGERIGSSRVARGERGVWQRRYWEHLIRDEDDLRTHVEYIHFNPVKHGYARRASDWPHSSIHRYIERGQIDPGWGLAVESAGLFGE
ncbi:REP-associated tyrosine transposase [Piscinibacter sp.]|jgi:putative transposase|uniref:REP-associated tyrosine transposase n=1 Tax=Piscinibacter sp. TaxID=1903157 RepID=UPI002F3F32BD